MNETEARRLVAARAHGRCELCGVTDPLTFSHRTPKGLGGRWTPANGVRLCGSGTTGCHGWVEHHPALAAAGGWRVVPTVDGPPLTEHPVWLNGVNGPGWWFLADDGGLAWQWWEDLGLPRVPTLPDHVIVYGMP